VTDEEGGAKYIYYYLANLIFFDIQKLIEVNRIVNPLRLDVLFGFFDYKVLPVCNNVSDRAIVVSQLYLSSTCQNYIFKRIPWYLSAEIKLESAEK
jgi:hypothetical protein